MKYLVSGSDDRTIKMWALFNIKQVLGIIQKNNLKNNRVEENKN